MIAQMTTTIKNAVNSSFSFLFLYGTTSKDHNKSSIADIG
jgi:ribosome biogenesis protein Nip4